MKNYLTPGQRYFDTFPYGIIPTPINFNPTLIPGFIAGYYSNTTTQTPPGSINPNLIGPPGQWWNINNLSSSTKIIQSTQAFNEVLINGLTVQFHGGAGERLAAISNDLLTSNLAFTLFILFRINNNTSTQWIFFHELPGASLAVSYYFELLIEPAGTLFMRARCPVPNTVIDTQSANFYDDNLPHIVVIQIDTVNKTNRMIIDGNESLTANNPAFVTPGSLTTTKQTPIFGGNRTTTAGTFFNGSTGDKFLFDSILPEYQINYVAQWIAKRFNIQWNNV